MNDDLLNRASNLMTKLKASKDKDVQAIVSKGNLVIKIVDGQWTSDDKVIADMLNEDLKIKFMWGEIYTPNVYAEMAKRAAKLLGGKVDYVIELPYKEGVIY